MTDELEVQEETLESDDIPEETLEEAPPVKTPVKEPPKTHEPPEGSKRWNEIYYEAKESKRRLAEFEEKLAEKDRLVEAAIEHNRSLQESVDTLYDKVSSADRPDPMSDPEAYDQWILDRAKRTLAKPVVPEVPKPVAPVKADKVQKQVAVMRSIYDDFDQIVEFAKDSLNKDPVKKNELVFSDNPPRALYEYGLEQKNAISNKRNANLESARVEGGSPPPTEKKVVLTPEQEHARKMLGISHKDYVKQLEFINRGK